MKKEQEFFESWSRSKTKSFVELPASGSARRNFVATDTNGTYIVTSNSDIAENESFFYFSQLFNSLKLNAPEIYEISADRTMYIQEFVGNQTLSQYIADHANSDKTKELVEQSLTHLHTLQQATLGKADYSQSFEYEEYNQIPIIHDLYYFKFMYADQLPVQYKKLPLLTEFKELASYIEKLEPKGLMIRDFQARNIMLKDEEEIFFIDYQSAMYGPLMYDVISFLYQAKANFSDEFREKMLDFYIEKFSTEDQLKLRKSIYPVRLIRNLQVLGAYGFRGIIQGKKHFLESIPQGIINLKSTAENWELMSNFPELRKLIQAL